MSFTTIHSPPLVYCNWHDVCNTGLKVYALGELYMIDLHKSAIAKSSSAVNSGTAKLTRFVFSVAFCHLPNELQRNIANDLLPNDAPVLNTCGALFSVGNTFTGTTINVFRVDDFNEGDPVYIVKGIHNGQNYEIVVNIHDLIPNNASEIEITALLTHLREDGIIDEVARPISLWEESDKLKDFTPFEKINYAQLFDDCYNYNFAIRNPDIEHVRNLGKIASALR